jgi:hypothetical protein
MPHAVVRPENEEELVELVKWAKRNGLPLVPAVTPLMVDYLKGKDISDREKPYGIGNLPWELNNR